MTRPASAADPDGPEMEHAAQQGPRLDSDSALKRGPFTVREAFSVWLGRPTRNIGLNIAFHVGTVLVLTGWIMIMPIVQPGHPGYGTAAPYVYAGVLGAALTFSFVLSWTYRFPPPPVEWPDFTGTAYNHVADRTMELWTHHESTRRSWITVFFVAHGAGLGLLQWLGTQQGNTGTVAIWFLVAALLAVISWTTRSAIKHSMDTLHQSTAALLASRPAHPLKEYYRILLPDRPYERSSALLTSFLILPIMLEAFSAVTLFLLMVL